MSILFCTGADRFGGRLSSILNTFRIAQDYKMTPAILWNRDHHLYPDMNQPELLFSDEFIRKWFLPSSFKTMGSLQFGGDRPVQMTQVARSHDESSFRSAVAKHDPFLLATMGCLTLPWEHEEEVVEKFAKAFEKVEFSQSCRNAFEAIDKHFGSIGDVTGIHLRRGDIIRDEKVYSRYWHGRYIPDEFFVELVERYTRQGQNIMLFSDDVVVKDAYRQDFPNLLDVGDIVDSSKLAGPIFDIAEFYALQRCRQIIAPMQSAFSQTASQIGNVPILRVFDLLSTEDIEECTSALFQRRRDHPDSFFSEGERAQVDLFFQNDHRARTLIKAGKIG